MPKLKVKRMEVNEIMGGVVSLLKCKDNKQEFNTALIRNKRFLKEENEEYIERMQKFQQDINQAISEYCKKDSEGNAVTHMVDIGGRPQTTYEGLQPGECPAYDERAGEINSASKKYRNEIIEIDYYILKKEFLPKVGWGAVIDAVLSITDIKFEDEKKEEQGE